eukprot:scaffold4523_cov63-Phaeocystis_antarctica.AAC.1
MRGSHYAIHVRGYAVLPVVDIRSLGLLCHAVSHQYKVRFFPPQTTRADRQATSVLMGPNTDIGGSFCLK